jgi:hypothetical protein
MDLKGIMAISGYSGLYKMVSQAKSNIIVESLNDGKRMPAFNSYKISSLEDIAIFTDSKEVPLTEVFQKLLDKFENKPAIDPKSPNNELINLFTEILPDYDKERVYVSDIKKVITWYNTLVQKDLLKSEPEAKEDNKTEEVANDDATKSEKPVKTPKPVVAKTVVKPKAQQKMQAKVPTVRKAGGQRKQGGE